MEKIAYFSRCKLHAFQIHLIRRIFTWCHFFEPMRGNPIGFSLLQGLAPMTGLGQASDFGLENSVADLTMRAPPPATENQNPGSHPKYM